MVECETTAEAPVKPGWYWITFWRDGRLLHVQTLKTAGKKEGDDRPYWEAYVEHYKRT
jgi:hypothetical protein